MTDDTKKVFRIYFGQKEIGRNEEVPEDAPNRFFIEFTEASVKEHTEAMTMFLAMIAKVGDKPREKGWSAIHPVSAVDYGRTADGAILIMFDGASEVEHIVRVSPPDGMRISEALKTLCLKVARENGSPLVKSQLVRPN